VAGWIGIDGGGRGISIAIRLVWSSLSFPRSALRLKTIVELSVFKAGARQG